MQVIRGVVHRGGLESGQLQRAGSAFLGHVHNKVTTHAKSLAEHTRRVGHVFWQALRAPFAQNGHTQKGDLRDNVRIIFVNGILNSFDRAEEKAEEIAELLGSRVYYTYSPTRGFFEDIINVIKGMVFGSLFSASFLLAKNIRNRLQEIRDDGRVVVITHSGGGAVAKVAEHLLSSQEQKRLCIYSFGSAAMFYKKQLLDATNYIALGDLVPFICRVLQPITWVFSPPIRWLGAHYQRPLNAHRLLGKAYHEGLLEVQTQIFSQNR